MRWFDLEVMSRCGEGLLRTDGCDFRPPNAGLWMPVFSYSITITYSLMRHSWFFLLVSICCIILPCKRAAAQAPGIQFSKVFGGNYDDRGVKLIQTIDKGYLLVGASNSTNGDVHGAMDTTSQMYDILVIKTDSAGTLQWSKVINTGGCGTVWAAAEGKYAFVVGGYCSGKKYDFAGMPNGTYGYISWLDKATGALIQSKGYSNNNFGNIYELQVLPDNSIIAAGSQLRNSEDMWLAKLDGKTGIIKWQKYYGGSATDGARAVTVTSDGFLVAGYTMSKDGDAASGTGGVDGFVVRTDTGGTLTWAKTFAAQQGSMFNSVSAGKTGDIYCAGFANGKGPYSAGNRGLKDYWIVKLKANGDTLWTRSYGGTQDDYASNIYATEDGGAALFGTAVSHDGDIRGKAGLWDGWLVRLNSSGTIVWDTTLGSNLADNALSMVTTCDNSYAFLMDVAQVTKDVKGTPYGNYEFWLCKMKPDGLNNRGCAPMVWLSAGGPQQANSIHLSPNPARGSCSVDWGAASGQVLSLRLSDMMGRSIKQVTLPAAGRYELSLEGVPAGLYYVTYSGAGWRYAEKLVVQ